LKKNNPFTIKDVILKFLSDQLFNIKKKIIIFYFSISKPFKIFLDIMSKLYFYCWYLGFTEVNGLIGQQYVIDGIQKLTSQSNLLNKNQNIENIKRKKIASKVTISLNETSLTLIGSSNQNNNNNNKKNHPVDQSAKSYTIDYEKISYITRLGDPKYSDIVALIIVNTDDETLDEFYHKKFQHPYRHIANLHAFKFDSNDSARRLEKYLNEYYFNYRQNTQKAVPLLNHKNINIKNLIAYNNKLNINNNSTGTITASSSNGSDYGLIDKKRKKDRLSEPQQNANPLSPRALAPPPRPAVSKNIDDITNEFKRKLFSEQPLLLPPKDYNTVMRSRGDLEKVESRRSQNQFIVGKTALEQRNQQILEKIDENQQVVNLSSPRSIKLNASRIKDDDDMSIDEDAKRALNYYDAVVNSIALQPVNLNQSTHYRFEPPANSNSNNGQLTKLNNSDVKSPTPSSISSLFNSSNLDNLKMNPLHIIDEEYTNSSSNNNKNSNYNRLKNHFNKQQNGSLKPALATIPPTAQSTPSLAFSAGFRSNALTKLGNYAPKALSKPPVYISASNDELQKNNYYKNQHAQKQFSSSLPTEQLFRLQEQQERLHNAAAATNMTYAEPEIDYYNVDTLDVHRSSKNLNMNKDSQFILKPNQIREEQKLFTKLNQSTPNMVYKQYYHKQPQKFLLTSESYNDVYY
jgi:hypothetical protein